MYQKLINHMKNVNFMLVAEQPKDGSTNEAQIVTLGMFSSQGN
jgi:hypothetical protein